MRLLWIFVYAVSAASPSQFPLGRAWVWGDGPVNESGRSLRDRYPDHGFIELRLSVDTLLVSAVRRPPDHVWPPTVLFCSRMLPAAINEFLHTVHMDLSTIKHVLVALIADPYIAAFKCYMRVFIDMGFTDFGYGNPMGTEDVDKFCEREDSIILGSLGDGLTAVPPSRADGDMALLEDSAVCILE